ncbi:MAG TPA: hypothetical protein VNH64_08190 [Parvularculaceae bacterium]|nr:hypothetical protein [Parvularculaceae bacterium]
METALLTYPSGPRAFGRTAARFAGPDTTALIRLRLQEKIENLEREARRLAFRGEKEAADVLELAAWKLKVIVKREPKSLAI